MPRHFSLTGSEAAPRHLQDPRIPKPRTGTGAANASSTGNPLGRTGPAAPFAGGNSQPDTRNRTYMKGIPGYIRIRCARRQDRYSAKPEPHAVIPFRTAPAAAGHERFTQSPRPASKEQRLRAEAAAGHPACFPEAGRLYGSRYFESSPAGDSTHTRKHPLLRIFQKNRMPSGIYF